MILIDQDFDPDPAPSPSVRTLAPARSAAVSPVRLPPVRTLSRFLHDAQAAVRLRGKVTVLLTTDAGIRGLNRRFRGKNKATDVLSFPAANQRVSESASQRVAGDIAISVPTAQRQAEEQGHTLGDEIKVLMLHGLLHLAGYDHEADNGQMARRERQLRTKLGLPLGLIERVANDGCPILAPCVRRKDGKAMSSRSRKP
jgi:probable rRNA maturation factor